MSWILGKSLLTSVLLVQPWRTEFTAGLDLGDEGHSVVSLEPRSLWNSLSLGEGMSVLEKWDDRRGGKLDSGWAQFSPFSSSLLVVSKFVLH